MQTTNLAAIDIGAGLTDEWRAVITFVPKLVAFLVILIIGVIIAKILAKAVAKILSRVGFERVAERGGLKRAMGKSKYTASDIVAKLVYYAIVLIALQFAFGVWGPNPVSDLLTDIVAWLPRAVVAIVIVVVAAAIANAVKELITSTMSGLSYGRVLASIASIFILALGVIAALNQIGVATAVTTPVLITVLATIGGIAVVGVGGGLIQPMRYRWENWLDRAEHEIPRMRETAEANGTTTGQAEKPEALAQPRAMDGRPNPPRPQ
jgi:small-conductance mechanosensitive channel